MGYDNREKKKMTKEEKNSIFDRPFPLKKTRNQENMGRVL
jgi:hypothetical protein